MYPALLAQTKSFSGIPASMSAMLAALMDTHLLPVTHTHTHTHTHAHTHTHTHTHTHNTNAQPF